MHYLSTIYNEECLFKFKRRNEPRLLVLWVMYVSKEKDSKNSIHNQFVVFYRRDYRCKVAGPTPARNIPPEDEDAAAAV